jgi:hypothetical protein
MREGAEAIRTVEGREGIRDILERERALIEFDQNREGKRVKILE